MQNAAQDLERLIREIVRDELRKQGGGGKQPFSNNRSQRPKFKQRPGQGQRPRKFDKPRRDFSRDRQQDQQEGRAVFGKRPDNRSQKPALRLPNNPPKAPDRQLDNSISGAKSLLARLKH